MSKGGALVRFHDWRTARDHKAATRHFWRCRCIGLVAVPVSIGLATLPGLRIGALSMAAFEFRRVGNARPAYSRRRMPNHARAHTRNSLNVNFV